MALKNQFQLQSVLNYTENIVDTLELKFTEAKLTHNKELAVLDDLEAAKRAEIVALQQQQQGSLNCNSILLHQQYLKTLETLIVRQTARVQQAEEQLQHKRKELVETMQNQKTLEKLRDNHVAAQRLKLHRREARAADDLVVTRYVRER